VKAARVSKGKILLVDDDPAVQRGLSALLLAANYDVEIFGSGDDFLAKRDNSLTAGAAMLVDVYMPGVQGLELLERLKKEGAGFPVVVMTAHGDVPMAVRAMRSGAVDFLEKPFTASEMTAALDRAFSSLQPVEEVASHASIKLQRDYAALTPREREVLREIVCGDTNKEIARKLDVSPRTVEVHRHNIMSKMEAKNFAELVRMAVVLEIRC